jgi:hypothetical protein
MTKYPKPARHRAFELRVSGFFRHYGLGISHFMRSSLKAGDRITRPSEEKLF